MNRPTYRFGQTYAWNYENGPDFAGAFPSEAPGAPARLLGFGARSPVGVSAGILLNARWVETHARLGFDILTYKTVRSAARPCYSLPNWVFLDAPRPLAPEDGDVPLVARLEPNAPLETLTSSVCFGMPSAEPDVWRPDVERARRALGEGQMLIVSVVGTPGDPPDLDALADDYALCARWAAGAGAHAVEANLSCPNVCTAEGAIFQNPDTSRAIAERIRAALPDGVPLLLKIGSFADAGACRAFLRAVSGAAGGVTLVNCLSRPIHNPDGTPAFGPGKERAGVLGWATRDECLRQTGMMLEARRLEGVDCAVLSVGGVTEPKAAIEYLNRGADAVLLGGAPVFDPFIAVRIKEAMAAGSLDRRDALG